MDGAVYTDFFGGSSSGLHLYAALVDLLAKDFLSEEANWTLTGKDKRLAFFFVLLGGKFCYAREYEVGI